jgi:hypothetical protein
MAVQSQADGGVPIPMGPSLGPQAVGLGLKSSTRRKSLIHTGAGRDGRIVGRS